MADFDLTQTDAQVQSILNDAQDAQGAGAQTTLTTDYIMLKDTSGNYHKILKDSFTEACRNVLAGLLVNNDKGTTISQIPAIASGDFGSVTPANLASVLGEAGWKSVSCAKNTSATLATIEQGATASSRRSFIFALKYDNENRIGLYAYKGEENEVVSILDANRVVIVSTPSSATNYEIYIDGETIKITNISAGTMTYLIKVI